MHTGTEYLSSNALTAYPFGEDALGIVYDQVGQHGADALMPADILVDALAVVRGSSPVYLSSIELLAPQQYRMQFTRNGVMAVLALDIDLTALNAANLYTVLAGELGFTAIKLVADTARLIEYLTAVTGLDTFGTRLPLERSAVEQRCVKVLSFDLYNNGLTKPPDQTGITDYVVLKTGYNVDIYSDASDLQDTVNITLDIAGGAGEGTVPCDDVAVQPIVRPKMNLIADQLGNIQLNTGDEGCYDVVPVPATGIFMLQGKCNACCSCADYDAVLKALKRLFVMGANINDLLTDAHLGATGYNVGVNHYNSIIVTRFARPTLTINGVVGSDYTAERVGPGAPNWVTFTLAVKNTGIYSLTVTTVTITLTSPAGVIVDRVAWDYKGRSSLVTPTGTIVFTPTGLGTVTPGTTVAFYVDCYVPLTAWDMDPMWVGNVTANIVETTGTGPVASILGPQSFAIT